MNEPTKQDIHLEAAGRSPSFYTADARLRDGMSQSGTGHAPAAERHFHSRTFGFRREAKKSERIFPQASASTPPVTVGR